MSSVIDFFNLILQAVAEMGGNASTSSVVAEVLSNGASQAGANQYGGTQLYSSGTGVIQRSSNNDGLGMLFMKYNVGCFHED